MNVMMKPREAKMTAQSDTPKVQTPKDKYAGLYRQKCEEHEAYLTSQNAFISETAKEVADMVINILNNKIESTLSSLEPSEPVPTSVSLNLGYSYSENTFILYTEDVSTKNLGKSHEFNLPDSANAKEFSVILWENFCEILSNVYGLDIKFLQVPFEVVCNSSKESLWYYISVHFYSN